MKQIKNFNYYITKMGKVYNSEREELKPHINKDGYKQVTLYDSGRKSLKRVCRLVAETYISNPKLLPVVNHKDSDRSNDWVGNLEWCTTLDNNRHGVKRNSLNYKNNTTLTLDKAHRICRLLQDNLRAKDVSEILGVSLDVVTKIRSRVTWKEVSCYYSFPERRKRVSLATAKWVYSKLEQGLSYSEILSESSNKLLTENIISLIDSKRIYKEIFNE